MFPWSIFIQSGTVFKMHMRFSAMIRISGIKPENVFWNFSLFYFSVELISFWGFCRRACLSSSIPLRRISPWIQQGTDTQIGTLPQTLLQTHWMERYRRGGIELTSKGSVVVRLFHRSGGIRYRADVPLMVHDIYYHIHNGRLNPEIMLFYVALYVKPKMESMSSSVRVEASLIRCLQFAPSRGESILFENKESVDR